MTAATCQKCGTAVRADPNAVRVICGLCLMQPRVGGKAGPVLAASPLRAAVGAACANAAADDGCLMREEGCAVLSRGRCGHFEVLLPLVAERARMAYARLHPGEVAAGGPSTRACPHCGGTLRAGARFCESCRGTRRRTAGRAAQQKRRATSAVAPKSTPLNRR
jgi:hypothetical protein